MQGQGSPLVLQDEALPCGDESANERADPRDRFRIHHLAAPVGPPQVGAVRAPCRQHQRRHDAIEVGDLPAADQGQGAVRSGSQRLEHVTQRSVGDDVFGSLLEVEQCSIDIQEQRDACGIDPALPVERVSHIWFSRGRALLPQSLP